MVDMTINATAINIHIGGTINPSFCLQFDLPIESLFRVIFS